jgi:signal transduction histidine kinase
MAGAKEAGQAQVPGPGQGRSAKKRQPEAAGRIGAPVPGAAEEALERCLGELVRCGRHSAVGRRVRGLVHQMNTPLQVLSFQVELLEQKASEEAVLLRQCPLPLGEKLENLRGYRLEKLRQFRSEVEKLQGLTRRLILQGVH